MKKVIIRSIVSICITYMLLSVILNVYYLIDFKQRTNEIQSSKGSEMHNEEASIPDGWTIGEMLRLNNFSGKVEVIYLNFNILICSFVLGEIIALASLAKEKSRIKFVLMFILGYIIVNLLLSILTVQIFKSNGIELSLVERYIDLIKYSIIPYSVIFLLIFSITKAFHEKDITRGIIL